VIPGVVLILVFALSLLIFPTVAINVSVSNHVEELVLPVQAEVSRI
jgi:hypothetical protein